MSNYMILNTLLIIYFELSIFYGSHYKLIYNFSHSWSSSFIWCNLSSNSLASLSFYFNKIYNSFYSIGHLYIIYLDINTFLKDLH